MEPPVRANRDAGAPARSARGADPRAHAPPALAEPRWRPVPEEEEGGAGSARATNRHPAQVERRLDPSGLLRLPVLLPGTLRVMELPREVRVPDRGCACARGPDPDLASRVRDDHPGRGGPEEARGRAGGPFTIAL